jgi:protein ImuB
MKRYASVWLMDWPVTAWRQAREQAQRSADARRASPPEPFVLPEPFALVERTTAGLILHAQNPAARTLGLRLQQSHADARAMVPALVSAPAEPEQARKALRRLAGWMERFSPFVTLDQSAEGLEGLFVDLTGGQHLFGGETTMVRQMLAALTRVGVPARIGVADTPGAAWALARYGAHPITVAPQDGACERLAALPVAALRLSPKAIQLLNRFGLRTIGALNGLPRAALARRFRDADALNVLQRLDQALGLLTEPLIPVTAPTVYRVSTVFAEPMTSIEAVAVEAAALAEGLTAALERDGMGARRLRLTGFRVDGRMTRLEVRLASGSRHAPHLIRLFRDKGFEHLNLGFGIDALALSAPVTEPLVLRQTSSLTDPAQALAGARGALVDRLAARLGDGAVLRPYFRERWKPEAAENLVAWELAPEPPPVAADIGPRPILLFDPPELIEAISELPDGAPARFTWRRTQRKVARASGPERLAPEWWRETGAKPPQRVRDYYRLEDAEGGRFWVFREGLYAQPEGEAPPSWWMHGLFP